MKFTMEPIRVEYTFKNKKEIEFVDSGSTYNFIDCKVTKDLNFFVYLAP